jgi:serine O-acetyltransferase
MGKFMSCCRSIRSDMFRYRGKGGFLEFFFLCATSPGFLATLCYRVSAGMRARHFPILIYWPVRAVALFFSRLCNKELPSTCKIGHGLCLLHNGTVVVNSQSQIGVNCTISQGVTIGHTIGGKHPGAPKIGDRVFIGPGAVVLGGIVIGDDAAIGANAVVTCDVAPSAVVVGIPAKEISRESSSAYIQHPWTEDAIR